MSQIHKSWSLHDLNSARIRTGACITQTQKDSRMEELQVESQNTVTAQRYRKAYNNIWVLKSKPTMF